MAFRVVGESCFGVWDIPIEVEAERISIAEWERYMVAEYKKPSIGTIYSKRISRETAIKYCISIGYVLVDKFTDFFVPFHSVVTRTLSTV
jgi:hypothetical protein